MKRRIYFAAALFLGGLGFARIIVAQSTGEPEPKFVTVGDVSKIDEKGKSITIRDAASYNITELEAGRAGGASAGGGRGGRGGGGVTGRGGEGNRRGGGVRGRGGPPGGC